MTQIKKAELPNDATLGKAKEFLRETWNEGAICPCCTQVVKLYKRKISWSMAYALILIYRYFQDNPGKEYVKMATYLLNNKNIPYSVRSGDNAKLKHWELIEPQPAVRDDGSNRAGYWKLTQAGRDFVESKIAVKSYAKLFNSKCYGLIGETIDIRKALGNKFNYDELMSV